MNRCGKQNEHVDGGIHNRPNAVMTTFLIFSLSPCWPFWKTLRDNSGGREFGHGGGSRIGAENAPNSRPHPK